MRAGIQLYSIYVEKGNTSSGCLVVTFKSFSHKLKILTWNKKFFKYETNYFKCDENLRLFYFDPYSYRPIKFVVLKDNFILYFWCEKWYYCNKYAIAIPTTRMITPLVLIKREKKTVLRRKSSYSLIQIPTNTFNLICSTNKHNGVLEAVVFYVRK